MTRPRHASYLGLLYVAGLLALLAVLAVLQYRWTGEASLAEQERMRQGLNESLGYFERAFDREITQVVRTYWGIPFSTVLSSADWQAPMTSLLADASRQWQASATDPRLINRIFIAEGSPDSLPRLYSFSIATSRLQTIEWPSDLSDFRNMFRPLEAIRREGGREDRYERRHLPGDFIIDQVPALVHVLANEPVRTRRENSESRLPDPQVPRLCLIVCLDRDYLFRERIPALARRYLSRETDNGYDYAITSRRNPELILCGSPGTDASRITASPDARVSLMLLQQEEFENQPPPEGLRRRRQEPQGTHLRRESPTGVPGGGGPPVEVRDFDRAAQERFLEGYRHVQAAAESLASQGWQLSAKHRSGSLNAAVASTRMRNLGVSLGILLLLAVSLVVLTVSVRRAQRLSRQQMEFVAGVSHELRTPIAVICSTAENLADGVITANEQVRRYGQYILREGWRLNTLVEQTMEFAGIGSGVRRFRMEPLDLGNLAGEALEAFRAQIVEKKLNIEMCVPPGALVNGDADALSCAIGNLISNAVKYSRPGGQIRVATEADARNHNVVLHVADQGMGIEASEVRHLFEPFFRGSNAVRAQIRGAGIGLSLVKSIVDAHRGTISVKSKIDQGTIFTLVLPAAAVAAAPSESPELSQQKR